MIDGISDSNGRIAVIVNGGVRFCKLANESQVLDSMWTSVSRNMTRELSRSTGDDEWSRWCNGVSSGMRTRTRTTKPPRQHIIRGVNNEWSDAVSRIIASLNSRQRGDKWGNWACNTASNMTKRSRSKWALRQVN